MKKKSVNFSQIASEDIEGERLEHTIRAINIFVSAITARLKIVLLYISIIIGHMNDVSKYLCCTNHGWSSIESTRTSSKAVGSSVSAVAKISGGGSPQPQ